MSEAVERFKTALADIPEVQNRLTAGQQFNAYDLARSKPYTNTVGIGPVFNLLSLADTMAPEAAELIEAALRLSVASLTGEGEPVAWRWRWKPDAMEGSTGRPSRWSYTEDSECGDERLKEVQPLYTRPVACPDREAVALSDCPPGLFLFNGTLGFKTEYRGMETVGPVNVPGDQVRWRVGRHSEVYVVSSGEAFWGGVTKKEDREALLVTPVDADRVIALFPQRETE